MKKVILPFLLLALAIPGMAGTRRYRKPDHRPNHESKGKLHGVKGSSHKGGKYSYQPKKG